MEQDYMNQEIKYEIHPKFNILYEMLMPTGKKIKSTLLILLIMVALLVLLQFGGGNLGIGGIKVNDTLTLVNLLKVICYVTVGLLIVKLLFHIIFQALQYKHISYRFYADHLTYEDDFLNQHKKNIEYSNIKEVEIRRTIWDRLLGYGIIVIYTNAENEYGNGMVIYSIKRPKDHYDIIEGLIHKAKQEKNNITIHTSQNDESQKIETEKQDQKSFEDSLKNIN